MSTHAQIAANQKNAQLSTGPVTPAGREKSSKNSTRHGFTGQTLIVTPQEKEAYDAHVAAYMTHHKVTDHKHKNLVQQLADAHWSVHQIFIQQTNTMALMTAVYEQMSDSNDPTATAKAVAPVARTLNTLSTYEVRRRRAAREIQEELDALEQELAQQQAEAARNSKETKPQPKIGSVCSSSVQRRSFASFEDNSISTDDLRRQVEADLAAAEGGLGE
jgi:hypothetical protein